MRLFPLLLLLAACDGPSGTDSVAKNQDLDRDGTPDEADCNPDDPTVYPGALEACDGVDQDCDDVADNGVTTAYYPDADGDRWGADTGATEACSAPEGYVESGGDCDDSNDKIHPRAAENDCTDPTYYNCDVSTGYADADGDQVAACNDCDDRDATINPDATEYCDGTDNNCDGTTDEPEAVDATLWYDDGDGDGYGVEEQATRACDQPPNAAAEAGDCNDADPAYNPGATEGDCTDPNDYNCDGSTGYGDLDGDSYPACLDCDDRNSGANPGATEVCNGFDDDCDSAVDEPQAADATTWYSDRDGDGYGLDSSATVACNQPAGYVNVGGDCDDGNTAFNPGELEPDCADPNDYNCDGATGYADADHDGYAACEDCDDSVATTNPGGTERCDGSDNDCDGITDESDAIDAGIWYRDSDADGYGDATAASSSCTQPSGYVANGGDCNDRYASAYPGGVETCNALDDDCDGTTDEADAVNAPRWYPDVDADGYGDANSSIPACTQPSGYLGAGTDCDDAVAATHPGAAEYCDGDDNDCDGTTDENSALDAATWYADTDGDNYGNAASTSRACTQPAGFVADATDCDDSRNSSYPRASEYCNGRDDDCDGTTDESASVDALTWYQDSDGDGYGNSSARLVACSQPSGYAASSTDCDDSDQNENPAASERCDGDDDDCDGLTDESGAINASTWYLDSDRDGYGGSSSTTACSAPSGYIATGGDCDDSAINVYPSAAEYCNGYDDDCDGTTDEASAVNATRYYADSDGDGYGNAASATSACARPTGYVTDATDCDDTNSGENPAASEVCDGDDDDCDGAIDENSAINASTYYLDVDGDNYGGSTSSRACSRPAGYSLVNTDCNDSDSSAYPGAPEYCDGVDDDCDGAIDDSAVNPTTWYRDADSDGYGVSTTSSNGCTAPSGYVSSSTDCNDGNANVRPGASETCNSIDDDCDGSIDEGVGTTYYRDADGDGFGSSATSTTNCTGIAPVGYRLESTDCNDNSVSYHPYAYDISTDATDHDCNGSTSPRVAYTSGTAGDDSSTTVRPASFTFPFCGTNYGTSAGSIYMISNGRITLGSSDTDYTPALTESTSDIAIEPYWRDLDATTGGIYWAEFTDALVFYWINVPEYAGYAGEFATFSAVLFDDGRVLFTYGSNTHYTLDPIVGITCLASAAPSETDWSGISYSAGYWGYGTGTERALAPDVDGYFYGDAFDLANSAIRLCATPSNSGLAHCAE